MASFASKLVGNSMNAASTGALGTGIADLVGVDNLPLLGNTKEARRITSMGLRLLGEGNWAIYSDIYPTTLAYLSQAQGNIQAVRDMQPRQPLLEAWERLHAARISQDDNELWAAGVDMVDYEQRVILQETVAQTQQQQQFWTTFSQNFGSRIVAPYPDALPLQEVISNGDYGNADHRMEWFEDELYPKAKQWLESHPDGINVQTLLSGGYDQ